MEVNSAVRDGEQSTASRQHPYHFSTLCMKYCGHKSYIQIVSKLMLIQNFQGKILLMFCTSVVHYHNKKIPDNHCYILPMILRMILRMELPHMFDFL
mmetsp:Transcript_24942/g.42422  ORF Transcript_24942/g.42422 Transcript_24942/m.42422 type:complete len:97 (-) Transcript_24942:522-812(-)